MRLQWAIPNRATYLQALDSPDPLTITISAMIPDGRYRLMDQEIIKQLERRLGRLHARQRLGIERDHEARVFGGGINFFHPENWSSVHRSDSDGTETDRALLARPQECRAHPDPTS